MDIRYTRFSGGLLVTLLGLLLSTGQFIAAQESITFTFTPPVGSVSEISEHTTATTTFKGQSQNKILTSTNTLRITQDGKGFRYTTTMGPMNLVRNGKTAPDMFQTLMTGLPFTDLIDTHGVILNITDDDTLRTRIKERAPEYAVAQMLAAAGHEQLLEKEKRDWQRTVSRFLGRTQQVGDQWFDTTEMELGNDLVPAYRATRILGWKKVQGHDVLIIAVNCDATMEGLAKAVSMTPKDLQAQLAKPLPAPDGYLIAETSELCLDPTTMFLYSETTTRRWTTYMVNADQTRDAIDTVENKEVNITTKPVVTVR